MLRCEKQHARFAVPVNPAKRIFTKTALENPVDVMMGANFPHPPITRLAADQKGRLCGDLNFGFVKTFCFGMSRTGNIETSHAP